MNTPSREETLFQVAAALSGLDRAAFLDRACADDLSFRARLDALLAAHEQSDGVLASHSEASRPTITLDLPELPDPAAGQTLGRYKLLERIGEGGCGVVYVAEQTEPVRRRVALKVIKLGMDTKQVVARFEAERQALAMMDHPNIAKVLDAGTTPPSQSQIANRKSQIFEGRPYFVMELVRGIRITDYCDQSKLSIKERLDLFIKVCQAIQHAHQKGIIHRDIKPSNILVTLHDGEPLPKVIDFGIAKATQGKLTDATVYTQLHQFIGTPAYMSPEQAEMSGLDIDTRSDIYSLGVLLYEMLTGTTPFDSKELIASGLDAMRKTIREKEPLRPSTRLRQTEAVAFSDRASRNSRHASLSGDVPQSQIQNRKSQIDPDLDWIVMKCLEKDRVRRYETANGLASDLKRHLHHEPVVARPPSVGYRFEKAWRRNRLWFSASAAVVLALVLGLGAAAIAWRQEAQARRQADDAAAETRLANQRAEAELLKARLSQAQALRSGHQPGRRGQALLAIAEAARRQPSFELRNEAIAALALTDFGQRESLSDRFWNGAHLPVFDARIEYALGFLQQPGQRSDRPDSFGLVRLRDDTVVREFPFQDGDEPRFWHLAEDAGWMILVSQLNTISRWSVDASAPEWRRTLDLTEGDWGNHFVPVSRGGAEVLLRTPQGLTALDGATGIEVRSLRLPPGASHIDFSRDGLRLALFMDSRVEVWSWLDGRLLQRWPLQGHPHVIRFSPTGTQVAVGVDLGYVTVFQVESGQSRQFAAHGSPVFRVCFGPGEETLMTVAWEGLTRWWDITTFLMLSETRGVDGPRFSDDGLRLGYSNGFAGSGVWSIERSEVFRELIAPRRANDGSYSVSFSADGRWLVRCGHQGWDLWDVPAGRVVHRQPERESVNCVFLGDGLELLTCGSEGVKLWTLSIDQHGPPRLAGPPRILVDARQRACSRVSYAASANRLALAAGARSVILDLREPLDTLELAGAHPRTVSVAFSPDARHVVTATWKGNGVSLFDAQTGQFVRSLSPESASIAFRPDSRQFAITTPDGYEVLDTASWEPLYSRKTDAATGGSGPVAYSPDGRWLAIAVDSRVIQLLDSETGDCLAHLTPPDGQNLFGLAFSPDGQTLAAAVQSHAVTQLWDLGRLRQRLRELHLDWQDSSALSPGGDSPHNREAGKGNGQPEPTWYRAAQRIR